MLALLLAACSPSADGAERGGALAETPVAAVDDAGRGVELTRPARRVVSLLPGATETLLSLGAGEYLVARTDFDRDPAIAHLPSVGGGLTPSLEVLAALRPDLVVAWEEAGTARVRPRLEELGIAVFALQTQDTSDIFSNIQRLGHLVGRDAAADSLAAHIRSQLAAVGASVADRPRPSVLYVLSLDPPMTAGPNTFLVQLIGVAGGRTVFPELGAHWPQISLEEILSRQPEVLLLPVGDDPAQSVARLRAAPGWRELRAVRDGRVATLPADLLNRSGPHIAESVWAIRDALHPEIRGEQP